MQKDRVNGIVRRRLDKDRAGQDKDRAEQDIRQHAVVSKSSFRRIFCFAVFMSVTTVQARHLTSKEKEYGKVS
jgi:hypothetical protein